MSRWAGLSADSDVFAWLLTKSYRYFLDDALACIWPSVSAWVFPILRRNRLPTHYMPPARSPSLVVRPTRSGIILAWERPFTFIDTAFSLYRGPTVRWQEALPVNGPIFSILDHDRQMIEYQCIDQFSAESEMICYWLVGRDPHQREQHDGPYVVQRFKVASFEHGPRLLG